LRSNNWKTKGSGARNYNHFIRFYTTDEYPNLVKSANIIDRCFTEGFGE